VGLDFLVVVGWVDERGKDVVSFELENVGGAPARRRMEGFDEGARGSGWLAGMRFALIGLSSSSSLSVFSTSAGDGWVDGAVIADLAWAGMRFMDVVLRGSKRSRE
jgi:hypothetical protein